MKNSLPVDGHHDDRRTLIEWVKDYPLRSCKVVVIHEDTEIGNHFHKKKDEIFYLLSGEGEVALNGETEPFIAGDMVFVPKGMRHTFKLKKGSVMLGAGTKPYDQKDENH